MNRLEGRTEILEPWLAEVDSDFFTPTVINHAINHEHKRFCGDTGAGPVAEFAYTWDGTTRFQPLERELVDIRRVDYDTTKEEITFLAFEHFSVQFGNDWISSTATGKPTAYTIMGTYSMGFEPIPANLKTLRIYGPIVPDDVTTDNELLLVSEMDGYVVMARAYVWLIERHLNRFGSLPPNYERIKGEAIRGTEEAKQRIRRLHGGIRVAGGIPSTSGISVVQSYGPLIKW